MSHTVKINVEFQDRAVLAAAVTAMGGRVLGEGRHNLYGGQFEVGLGFTLPNWRFPLVLKADNSLAFDDYRGSWGNRADITKLTGLYAVQKARAAATAQGWMSEIQANGTLLIYHPDGGSMTVKLDGSVDCDGFVGQGCNAATVIENSIGRTEERNDKPEFFSESANIFQS